MRHIERPAIHTQLVILNLFGDYLHPRQRALWTSGLLCVLDQLGLSERAVRSTLSRMKAKGWLRSERVGRRSLQRLTAKGLELLEEGDRRIFGSRPTHWDGLWHVVIYSLPHEMRSERRQLRARLSWLGYGMLAPGTMVAARARREDVLASVRELHVEPYVHFFTRARLMHHDSQALVERCWNLPALNRAYARFVARHREAFDQLLCLGDGLTPPEAFVERFWVTYEYSAFPRSDPYLPPELLPPDWRGDEAAMLFSEYRERLRGPAQTYVDDNLELEPLEEPQWIDDRLSA